MLSTLGNGRRVEPCRLRVCKNHRKFFHKTLLGQLLELLCSVVFIFWGKIAVIGQIFQPFQTGINFLHQLGVPLGRCGRPDFPLNTGCKLALCLSGTLPQLPAFAPHLLQDIIQLISVVLQLVSVVLVQGKSINPFAEFCLKGLKLRRSYASLPHLPQGIFATGYPPANLNNSRKTVNPALKFEPVILGQDAGLFPQLGPEVAYFLVHIGQWGLRISDLRQKGVNLIGQFASLFFGQVIQF